MSNTPFELFVEQSFMADAIRRTLTLSDPDQGPAGTRQFYFDLVGEQSAPPPAVLDGFVLAVIFIAMRAGRPLRIHGNLSRSGCFNISEFQSVWGCWRPDRYRRIDLIPDDIVDVPRLTGEPRAISAFSGGVDGIFTAIRHSKGWLGNASYPLTDVMMVHGFDVPLGRPESFNALVERIRPLLIELGLNLRVIRTNLKETSGQDWEDTFGAQLGSCFHNYSHDFPYALMGNDEPYSDIVYPWGSTPITNHLLSGDNLQLVIDGAASTRTEKVAEISRIPASLRILKVCWEGNTPEKNCGKCEKCIRTKMNLLAVGISDAPCFDEPCNPGDILRMRVRNKVQLAELQSIYRYVRQHGVQGQWVDNLKQRIDAYDWKPGLKNQILRFLKKRLLDNG